MVHEQYGVDMKNYIVSDMGKIDFLAGAQQRMRYTFLG
jgi:hypothetical protein